MEQNPQLGQIRKQAQRAVAELCDAAHLRPGALFVVGCSSSEVLGERIGTHTSMDVAGALYEGIASELKERGVFLAAQCCEHLNRALVVERTVLERYDLEQVNAIPQPNHAGGAFASFTWNRMADPVLVESLSARADAGIDIGGDAHRHAHSSGCCSGPHLHRPDRRGIHPLCKTPAQICRRPTCDL